MSLSGSANLTANITIKKIDKKTVSFPDKTVSFDESNWMT